MCIDAATSAARLLSLIERCIAAKDLRLGRHLHCHLLKTALTRHTVLANRLIHLYSLFGSLPSAIATFADLPFKNHHSYKSWFLPNLARRVRELRPTAFPLRLFSPPRASPPLH